MQIFGFYLKDEKTVFSDPYFTRQTCRSDNPECSVIIDTHLSSQISFCFFSFPDSVTEISFLFDDIENSAMKEQELITARSGSEMYWLPSVPFIRSYDANQNIISESACSYEFKNQGTTRLLNIIRPGNCPGSIEYIVVICRKNPQDIRRQIQTQERRETDRIQALSFFDYTGLDYFWKSLIRGRIYRITPGPQTFNHFACEQNALYLYLWFGHLEMYTGKQLYAILMEYIAYNVLLRLSDEGRWKHGFWTEANETHARMQLDGIQLLCLFYGKQPREIFRMKAVEAMDYLIRMSIPLRKGIWFLHDSLETSEAARRLYYRQFIKTNVFGKTISSTLCLNTHIYTIIIMEMLSRISMDDRYKVLIEQGMESLLDILSNRPMGFFYGIAYGVRDFLLHFQDNRAVRKVLWKYHSVLSRKITPFLKERYPRLIMPNGFLERDLCVLHVSDGYHLINLLDLLMLYRVYPGVFLEQTIRKSMAYTFSGGFLKLALKSTLRPARFLAEILWLFICQIDDTWLFRMSELLYQFRKKGIFLGPLVQSSPMMSDESLILKPDNEKLVWLSCPKSDKFIAAIFNPSDSPEQTKIVYDKKDISDKLVWLNNEDQMIAVHAELVLPPKGYAILVERRNANID